MEGTLEAPPIVLRTSRAVMLMVMAVCAVLLPLTFWLMTTSGASLRATVGGAAGFAGCCAGLFLGLAKIIHPDQLEISPSGLRYQSLTQDPFDVVWSDVDGFRLWQGSRGTTGVVLNLTEEARAARHSSWLTRSLTGGADFSLAGGWPVGPDALVDLLKSAQARWAR